MRLSKARKQELQRYCNLFPEVLWDRYCVYPNQFSVFGWIDRDDGKHDVLILHFSPDEFYSYMTTSARYSLEFGERVAAAVGGKLDHESCKRVEYLRLSIKSIKLGGK